MFMKAFRGKQLSCMCLFFLALFATGCGSAQTTVVSVQQGYSDTAAQPQTGSHNRNAFFKGKTTSLSWIIGHDCQSGIQAYQQSARANPDVAVVGTGWLDPTNGQLIDGSNNCIAGSNSMDSIVKLIHSKGGLAYLTITMDTGDPNAWTQQQAATYIDEASKNQGYIDAIMREVDRAGYDGAIMDLEGVSNYPNIRQLFATYNQRLHKALQAQHKWYGIALAPKTADVPDGHYGAFEDWRLLVPTVDFMVIMVVDQSYYSPGPTMSLDWLNAILDYVLQIIPEELPRIIWEIPLYGATWHWSSDHWVLDNSLLTYQQAQAMAQQAQGSQIDKSATNLRDPYQPHITYTDGSGVKRAVWFFSARSLFTILVGFWQELALQPQFKMGTLQVAVWWRTMEEPRDFWGLLDTLY